MAIEDIRQILTAEAEADKLAEETAQNSAKITDEAEAKGRKLYEQLVSEGEAKAASTASAAEAAVMQNSKKASDAADAEAQALKDRCSGRIEAAAELIIKKVVNA